jgi:hypothetical protein
MTGKLASKDKMKMVLGKRLECFLSPVLVLWCDSSKIAYVHIAAIQL